MQKEIIIAFIIVSSFLFVSPQNQINETSIITTFDYNSLPKISGFIENVGQWGPEIYFIGQTDYGFIGFCRSSVIHYIVKRVSETEFGTMDVVQITFHGSDDIIPIGCDAVPGEYNYILGSDPSLWGRGARSFEKVVFTELWIGVDLTYFYTKNGLKYEFEIAPGTDPSFISMNVEGGIIFYDRDSITIMTANSSITDGDLYCYIKETGRAVESSFQADINTIQYEIGGYDNSMTLVIDPLIYSTYIGGSMHDNGGMGICVDGEGNTYITGHTHSFDFPTSPGSYDTSQNGYDDAYLIKLDPTGKNLVYSTFIGGRDGDRGRKIHVDEEGQVIMVGYTHSKDFPTTPDAYQRTLKDGPSGKYDSFVLKLNTEGNSLIFSTYIGASGIENAEDLSIDTYNRIVITGYTSSSDYPILNSNIQDQHNGDYDIFLTCLEENGSSLAYSLIFGGKGNDWGQKLAIAPNGDVYVIGRTESTDITTTLTALSRTYSGNTDGLIIGFGDNGTRLVYSSYIGGSSYDGGRGIVIDDEGEIYICGETASLDFPSVGVQYNKDGNLKDAFILRLNTSSNVPIFSSRFGGDGDDVATTILLDVYRNVMITGSSYSTCLPLTELLEGPGGVSDCYFARFSVDGGMMLNCIQFGGSGLDVSIHMVKYGIDEVRICGRTESNDFPMKGTPYDNTPSLNPDDAFIAHVRYRTMPGQPREPFISAGDGYIELVWTQPLLFEISESLGYVIYKGLNPDALEVYNVTNRTYHLDINVTNGQMYHYRVCAFNVHGEGMLSDIVNARPAGPPGIPILKNLTDGDRWVNISWEKPNRDGGDPIIGYRIYRTSNSSKPHILYKTVYEKRINDADVVNGGVYRYMISAFNINGEGNMTEELIGMPSKIPDEPLEIYAHPGDGWVNVSWSITPSDGGSPILHYEVMRGSKADSLVHLDHTEHALHLLDTEVENGMEYHYAVRACNIRGPSPLSDIIRARPARQPNPPFNLTAESGDRKVILKWSSPEWDGGQPLNRFTIYRRSDDNWTYLEKAEPHDSEYTDSEVINGIEYHYMITAWNIMGESLSSNIAYATPMTYPGKPLSLVATGGDSHVSLTWLPPISNGGSPLIEYMLHRGGTSSSMELITEMPPDKMEYTDLGLENGVTYYYQIWCRNSVGVSIGSDLAFAIPATIPQPPSSISAIAGNSFVEITWGPTDDAGGSTVKKTILYRGLNENDVKKIADLDMTSGTYKDRSVENGVEYHYRLSCVNSLGEGPLSIPVVARPSTTPEMVLNLTCIIKDGGIHLTWNPPLNDGGSAIHGYNIYRSSGSGPRIKLAVVNDTYYSDGSIYKEILYVYSVTAFNDNGEGEASNEVEIMIEREPSILPLVIGAVIAILLLLLLLVGAAIFLQKRNERKKFVAGPPITAYPATEAVMGESQEILQGSINGGSLPSEPEDKKLP